LYKPDKIIIHASDSEWGDVAEIDRWHKERGWDGIGYHFVILNSLHKIGLFLDVTTDGMLQFGRPLDTQGAHCIGQNSSSIGICLIGVKSFSDAQQSTLMTLCKSLMNQYDIELSDIYGHNEFNENKTCPNFDVNDWIARWVDMDAWNESFVKPESDRLDSIEEQLARINGRLKSLERRGSLGL